MLEFLKYLAFAIGVLPQIYNAVKEVEALVQEAQAGAYKKELVLQALNAVLDVADDFVKSLDKERIVAIAGKLIDAIVALLNLKGEFVHQDPTK
jgi:hypothetical protein